MGADDSNVAATNGATDRTDGGAALSMDVCLELLANRQRRLILGFFVDSNEQSASIDELVSEIVEDEIRRSGEQPGRDAIRTTLFHVHLPKFADAGVLKYDTRHTEVLYYGDHRIEELYAKIQESG